MTKAQVLARLKLGRLLSGQFLGHGKDATLAEAEKVYKLTKRWPAIVSADYCRMTIGRVEPTVPNQSLIAYASAGGLVSVSAHLGNPLTGKSIRDPMTEEAFAAVLTSPQWVSVQTQLHNALRELRDAGIVVLFRPLHEMNGKGWWYGRKDPATFITLWRGLHHALNPLNNLLWCYSPMASVKYAIDYYPGSDVVDLVGLDVYQKLSDWKVGVKGYTDLVATGKPFIFFEVGPKRGGGQLHHFDWKAWVKLVKVKYPAARGFIAWNDEQSLSENQNAKSALSDPYVVNR